MKRRARKPVAPEPEPVPQPPQRTLWAALLIVAVGLAAYSNSFHGPFIFDDLKSIVENATIRRFWSADVLSPPQAVTVARRPVVNVSLAFNYAVGGLDVRGYHVFNLAVHLAAGLALFGVVRRTLKTPLLSERYGRHATALATAAAVLWVAHPLQTESVTYVVQRCESLMGLFFLLTLYCAIRGAAGTGAWGWYAGAVASCVLGVTTKEVGVVAPAVVLLYDRAFLGGTFREALRRRWGLYLGLAATWGLFGALMMMYPSGGASGAGFGLRAVTPWEYARTQPIVILHYLRLCFWPHPLCIDYGWPVATSVPAMASAGAVVALLAAATLWALWRVPAIGYIGAWFFLILAPTSSFMPIADLAFEHRMYLPLAVVAVGAVLGAHELFRRTTRTPADRMEARDASPAWVAWTAFVCVAVALCCGTWDRNRDYRSALAIWEDTVRQRPENGRAYLCRGTAKANAGLRAEALRDYDMALKYNPTSVETLTARGAVRAQAGRYEEAIEDYDRAIRLSPKFAEAYNNRGAAHECLGRRAVALGDYDKAIALKPNFAQAYCNRGVVRFHEGRYEDALRDFDRALSLQGDYADAYLNRGAVHFTARRMEDAVRDFSRAIALKPDWASPYANRGASFSRMGRFAEAVRDCTAALKLKPGHARACRTRAEAYYELKEYDKAWADVRRLEELGAAAPPEFAARVREALKRGE